MAEGGRAGCAPGSFHARMEREPRFVCAEHMNSTVPQPPGLSQLPQHHPCPRVPKAQGGSSIPRMLPGGAGTPPCRQGCEGQRIRSCICLGAAGASRSSPRGWEPLSLCWVWGCRGAPPARPSPHSAAPFPRAPLRSVASLPAARSPLQSGSFHIIPWHRNVFPQPVPKSLRLPGTPSPPGIPFPSAGSSGVCTHPLPAAVALSLETGSDSGSITF